MDISAKATRQSTLKQIIRSLHEGASVEDVKERFAALIQGVSASEIAEMEQALVAEGLPVEEITRLCDVHVAVFRGALDANVAAADGRGAQVRSVAAAASDASATEDEIQAIHMRAAAARGTLVPKGHPVERLRAENEELTGLTAAVREALGRLGEPPEAERLAREATQLTADLSRLASLADRHYVRKENQLFPRLEDHGITAPPKVMWAVHDDIRALAKGMLAEIGTGDAHGVATDGAMLAQMIDDMVYKEENILFPLSIDALTDEDWRLVATDEEAPAGAAAGAGAGEAVGADAPAGAGAIPLTTGALTPDQLDLMLSALPMDVTFVDEEDRVAFFSSGERIFPRSPGVIGRSVQNCHPPKSVHIVERILDEFRAGTKDLAEFWIQRGGRFVHIRYFAVRDDAGAYKGTVELSQDVTGIRELQGEQRLLDW